METLKQDRIAGMAQTQVLVTIRFGEIKQAIITHEKSI